MDYLEASGSSESKSPAESTPVEPGPPAPETPRAVGAEAPAAAVAEAAAKAAAEASTETILYGALPDPQGGLEGGQAPGWQVFAVGDVFRLQENTFYSG